MTSYNDESQRDPRVIAAWIVLALQIAGLIWLLLFGQEQLAALRGEEPAATAAAAATAVPDRAAEDVATAGGDATTGDAAAADSTAVPTAAPEPTAAPDMPSAEEAGVIAPEDIAVDASLLGPVGQDQGGGAPEWLAQVVEGVAPDAGSDQPGIPPHLLLNLVTPQEPGLELAAPDAIDLSRPQVRVVPIAALLAWLQARNDTAGQEALEDLQSLLDEQPAPDEASVPLSPLLSGSTQPMVARVTYEGFNGGHGVGYIGRVTADATAPLTDESGLNYFFQGVTADGKQYVFMSWPVAAAFLSAASGASADPAADADAYYSDLKTQLAAADDLEPAPEAMADMVASLAIGPNAAEAAAQTAAPGSPADAVGFVWNWTGIMTPEGGESAVENPENYTLALLPDGTYTFRADCNVGGGAYEYGEDGALTLLPGPMTLVACDEDSQADAFLAFLSGVNGVSVAEDGAVTMTTADGGSATFINAGPVESPAGDDALVGTVWQWTDFQDTAELNDLTIENPEAYLVTFLPDGAFTVKADCNVGRGEYAVDGSALTMTVGPMTRAACGEDSLGDRFVQFLNATATHVFDDDGRLVLNLKFDSGNLIFADGGPAEMPAEAGDAEAQPAADAAGVTGITLQWPGFTAADGNAVAVENPEDYFLVLLPDGTFTFKADCNVGTGVYEYGADGALSLTTGAMTLAVCPEGSQSDVFVSFLNDVAGVAVDAEGNPTVSTADGRSATFVNLGPVETPANETTADGDLLDVVWQWTALGGPATDIQVDDPERYYLVFLDDGTYLFVADCNRGSGTYTRDGSTLALAPGPMTLVACADGSQSDQFVALFDQVEGYIVDGDNLVLSLTDGGVATLGNGGPFSGTDTGGGAITGGESGQAAPLAGVTWRWVAFRDTKQEYAVPAAPDYTLVFNEDGTVNVVADCNNGSGTYTINSDATMTISVQAMTRAACPSGSLSDTFIEYLNQAGPFEVDETGALLIDLMADGGRMTFVAEP